MILTIGMIVKNEEKYLEKCLTAIQPIRDSVDCELIITDTGSTDRTVEIAERFADKVIRFEWCNDFSAARNTTVKAARGEWYMFLDADDIFRSCDGIIGFFNSGEYKEYNAASYTSHNLTIDENVSVDYRAPRLVKLRPETRFVGVVHEALNTYGFPVKNIYDVADHYGYIYENEEQRQAKNKRNIDLLLIKLESDQNADPIIYLQLFQSYMGMDRDKAFEYIDKGIDICRRRKYYVLSALLCTKAFAYYTEDNFSAALNVCEEYFGADKSIRPGALSLDIEVYAIKASALYKLERYGEAVKVYDQFFDTFYAVKKGKINTAEIYATQLYLATDSNYMKLACDFLTCCIRAGAYDTALERMIVIPAAEYPCDSEQTERFVELELTVLREKRYERLSECIGRLDELGKRFMRRKLFFMLYSEPDRQAFLNIFIKVLGDDTECLEKAELYRSWLAGELLPGHLYDHAAKYSINANPDMLYIAVDCGFDATPLLGLPDIDLKMCAYTCCRLGGFYEALERYPADAVKDADNIPGVVKLYDICMSVRLADAPGASDEEKQALIRGSFAVKSALAKRYNESMSGGMTEFERLAAAVKANVRRYIASGDIALAEKTLNEYARLAPNDAEIHLLSDDIIAVKNRQ